jgi:ABC-type branched-subunit amino acid transport system ATPase component
MEVTGGLINPARSALGPTGFASTVLSVRNVTCGFDGVKAVDNLSFDVAKGSITALIGPNGAGKTTIFNVISGLWRPQRGEIFLGEVRITRKPVHEIARLGIGRTFQTIRLWEDLSVLDNVLFPMRCDTADSLLSALLRTRRMRQEEEHATSVAAAVLGRVGLSEKRDALAKAMSHGQRKLLEIARVVALDPSVLLLDEPMAGLYPEAIRGVVEIVRQLRDGGKTVMFIEHNMNIIRDMADRVIVLNCGRRIAEGTPAEIANDASVREAYMGRSR